MLDREAFCENLKNYNVHDALDVIVNQRREFEREDRTTARKAQKGAAEATDHTDDIKFLYRLYDWIKNPKKDPKTESERREHALFTKTAASFKK